MATAFEIFVAFTDTAFTALLVSLKHRRRRLPGSNHFVVMATLPETPEGHVVTVSFLYAPG
jgi:hypothetical protein